MPQKPSIRYVPARYVGGAIMRLRPHPPLPGGVYRDGDGKPRTGDKALILNPGDTLMIPETELRGQTYLVDPSGLASEAEWLGPGVVLLPEHAGLSRDDLIGVRFIRDGKTRQYEFHEGRSDFQEIDTPWPHPAATPDPLEAPRGNASDASDAAGAAPTRGRARKGSDTAASDAVPTEDGAALAQGA